MSARSLVRIGTVVVMLVGPLLGAAQVAALPFLVNRGFQTCGHFPQVAAENTVPDSQPDDPVGTANCPALCDKWVVACRGAVDASKSCWTKTIAKFATLQAAICSVQSGAAQTACKAALNAERLDAIDQAEDSRDRGIAFCEGTGLDLCLLFTCN